MDHAITAIVPAHHRKAATLNALRVIQECNPRPAEIIVYVDGGETELIRAINEANPDVKVFGNSALIGPGGARNLLIAAAANELVANFDDDSFPARPDYFARVLEDAALFPNAAVISAASHEKEWQSQEFQSIAVPSGCGCVFRKSWFSRTSGFVPLPIAYNMEEVDIGLQLHALGGIIVHDPGLRVIHEHPPAETVSAQTNAVVLANTALLPFLRYPWWLWPIGAVQILSRIRYLIRMGWTAGLRDGLRLIPAHLSKHRSYRKTVPSAAILSWHALRRHSCILLPDARVSRITPQP